MFPSTPVTNNANVPAARFDVARVRADFPILARRVGKHPLAYLDNAASAQKPDAVVETLARYYRGSHANIHRGVHCLSEEATVAFEKAREQVAAFLNASTPAECVLTRGTTEGINLVAGTWGAANLRPGDEILLTALEHHANIVPWQQVAARTGARIRVVPVAPDGALRLDEYRRLLSARTRMVAVAHASNALGTVNALRETIIPAAHATGALVLVDAAQTAPHLHVDVRALDADFLVFSGHKVFGPTGIGVLYGKLPLLNAMPPYQCGGDMIRAVDFENGTTFRDAPERFEAGTPNIAGTIALGVALDYLRAQWTAGAQAHEEALLRHATARLGAIAGLRILGTAPEKVPVVSFLLEGVHPHDVGTMLDADGIAVRTGHHCAMPLMKALGVGGTIRASFAFYNTLEEVDRLASSLERIQRMF
ncbi:MAG: SufS family cysteine desulfurase [Puniceicoccales bacterium]|nr:SufS family cysteine desulfurase [Puniceicoccales bacterium]